MHFRRGNSHRPVAVFVQYPRAANSRISPEGVQKRSKSAKTMESVASNELYSLVSALCPYFLVFEVDIACWRLQNKTPDGIYAESGRVV